MKTINTKKMIIVVFAMAASLTLHGMEKKPAKNVGAQWEEWQKQKKAESEQQKKGKSKVYPVFIPALERVKVSQSVWPLKEDDKTKTGMRTKTVFIKLLTANDAYSHRKHLLAGVRSDPKFQEWVRENSEKWDRIYEDAKLADLAKELKKEQGENEPSPKKLEPKKPSTKPAEFKPTVKPSRMSSQYPLEITWRNPITKETSIVLKVRDARDAKTKKQAIQNLVNTPALEFWLRAQENSKKWQKLLIDAGLLNTGFTVTVVFSSPQPKTVVSKPEPSFTKITIPFGDMGVSLKGGASIVLGDMTFMLPLNMTDKMIIEGVMSQKATPAFAKWLQLSEKNRKTWQELQALAKLVKE